jgi:hypothetical protein
METVLGSGDAARTCAAHVSALRDRGGQPLGHLVLLRDTTTESHALAERILNEFRRRDTAPPLPA